MTDGSGDLPAAVARRRVSTLQQLTVDLATARTPEDVCRVACEHAGAAMGAVGSAAWYVDRLHRSHPGAAVGVLADRDLDAPDLGSFARASRAGTTHLGLWTTPALSLALRAGPGEVARTATLTAGGTVVGALALTLTELSVAAQDPGLLATVVRTAGETLGRAVSMDDSLRLTAIVESSTDLMARTSADGRLQAWNPAAQRILGHTAEEVIGRHVSHLSPGGRLDEPTQTALDRVRDGRGPQHVVGPRLHRDGSVITMSLTLSPILGDAGQLDGVAVIGRDITERIQAQKRIRRLAAALDAAPFAVLITDDRGVVVECSTQARPLLGVSPVDVLGHDVRDAARVPPELGAPIAAALEGRSSTGLELRTRRDDGSAVQVQGSAFPVHLDNGLATAGVFLGVDVTESATMAEALRQARMLEALGRLAGGVAHDVNNVLTIVDGYARIALDQVGEGTDAHEAIGHALGATARLQRLTRRLLAFSRRRPADPEPLDVREVVAELVPMLRSLVGPTVVVTADLGTAPARIVADLAAVEQVVLNLVLNARDAMPGGGPLTVALRERPDTVELTVTDTGEGMSEAVAARVFEPFFTTKRGREDQGTGLGLTTVHAAVAEAGGMIDVDSALGRGTRVTVRFPRRDDEPGPAAGPAAARPGTGLHVLVVDDEPALQRLAARVLERAGYRVTTVGTPGAAVDAMGAGIDVLVSDVQLPGESGYALVERLPAGLPVVLMSGFAPEGSAPARGVFLDKPFTPESLTHAVAEAVGTADPQRPPPATAEP